jgi:DNA polymerase III delta prime subunit
MNWTKSILTSMQLAAHAYVVQGGAELCDVVLRLLEKEGIDIRGNSDVFVQRFSHFSIEDARSLRERASLRALGAQGRIFIVSAPTIPTEAQNALLKTFEEPPAGAKFFLIVPSPEMLLPTLRSRMQPLVLTVSDRRISVVDAKVFLASSPEERISLLEPLIEKDDDDKRDMAGAMQFLSDLEKLLSKNALEHGAGLRTVYRARKYLTDRGALVKPLLEHVALLVPRATIADM